MFGRKYPIVVSKHIIRDRQQRLGQTFTAQQLEALINRFGKYSSHPPARVHPGKDKADAWCLLDTGRAALIFPLVIKHSGGKRVYLATTVIRRESQLDGVVGSLRRFRIWRAK